MVDANGHDLSALHPSLQALLAWCEEQWWTIRITSTSRIVEQQTVLFNMGRTTPNPWSPATPGHPLGPTVAPSTDPAQHSKRSDGWVHAFDCFPVDASTPQERADVFQAMAFQGKSLSVVWGGIWSKPDDVHFETSVWRSVAPIAVADASTPDDSSTPTGGAIAGILIVVVAGILFLAR